MNCDQDITTRSGFRDLSAKEQINVAGSGDIIVTGNSGDVWTVSVTPGDLALIGIFDMGGGGPPSTTDQFGGDGGGGGGGGPLPGETISEEQRKQNLNANEDSERQEAIERTLEALYEASDENGASWTFEYNEQSGFYIAVSSDGNASSVTEANANDYFDRNVS